MPDYLLVFHLHIILAYIFPMGRLGRDISPDFRVYLGTLKNFFSSDVIKVKYM